MRWQGRQRSGNVEDGRGGGGGMAIGGGIGGIILLVLGLLFGGNPSEYINMGGGSGSEVGAQGNTPAADDPMTEFVEVVLQDTEDVWNTQFQQQLGREYEEPKLRLFTGAVQSGCGNASSASGPFYCPADRKVYIDLSFYQQLRDRFQAPGDFAMVYVIAHEVGHHIQNQLGIAGQVHNQQQRLSKAEANALSVRLELQADFLAGVFAHYNKKHLEAGDIEEALRAANAIGDDRLQREAQGQVVPESFTHGTSEQRMYWFKRGFETGDLNQGDTFKESL